MYVCVFYVAMKCVHYQVGGLINFSTSTNYVFTHWETVEKDGNVIATLVWEVIIIMYTMDVRTKRSHCMFTHYVHYVRYVRSICMFTLFVLDVCSHCTYVLTGDTCDQAEWSCVCFCSQAAAADRRWSGEQ
jgi:hypothetical protein